MTARDAKSAAGFTLVEVLVALMVIAIGLAALMIAVSGTARTSGMLRDKTIAGWIALNRLAEVRLNLKSGQNNDTGELDFANRKWHYDTRYFNTSINSMKRVVVRVYAGDAKAKGNPLIETVGFAGTQISPPGSSNAVLWTTNSGPLAAANGATPGTAMPGTTTPGTTTPGTITPGTTAPVTPTPGTTGITAPGTTTTNVSTP